MLRIRKAAERGHANHGWLDSRHTFSFAGYHDPREMGSPRCASSTKTASSRRWASGTRPPRHGDHHLRARRALEHKDSMGSGSVIRPATCRG